MNYILRMKEKYPGTNGHIYKIIVKKFLLMFAQQKIYVNVVTGWTYKKRKDESRNLQ